MLVAKPSIYIVSHHDNSEWDTDTYRSLLSLQPLCERIPRRASHCSPVSSTSRLPGGRGAQQAVTEPGSADHHGPQVRLAAERRAWRGDQQQRVRGEVRDDAGELLVRGGGRGSFRKTERAKIDYGQRTASQHRSGELAGRREVLSDVAGRRGDRERGAGPDGRDAAGQAAEQPPVGALVELLVVTDDLRHRGDAGAGPGAEHRGQRRAGARAFRFPARGAILPVAVHDVSAKGLSRITDSLARFLLPPADDAGLRLDGQQPSGHSRH